MLLLKTLLLARFDLLWPSLKADEFHLQQYFIESASFTQDSSLTGFTRLRWWSLKAASSRLQKYLSVNLLKLLSLAKVNFIFALNLLVPKPPTYGQIIIHLWRRWGFHGFR